MLGQGTCKASTNGTIGPFGTAVRESGQLSDTPNHSVEIDWQALFDERAAIREYDGRHTRAEAERLAWGALENRWHMQYGDRQTPALDAVVLSEERWRSA